MKSGKPTVYCTGLGKKATRIEVTGFRVDVGGRVIRACEGERSIRDNSGFGLNN